MKFVIDTRTVLLLCPLTFSVNVLRPSAVKTCFQVLTYPLG